MRKKVLMGLGILVVALVIVACNPASTPCPTCSPCPPTPTCVDTSDLETQLAACEATLTAIAGEGAVPPTCTPTGKNETICDGIDDDCDGGFHEDYQAYTCGVGACERLSQCVQGVESCTAGEGQPEICDNRVDDDCDGLTDTEDTDDCPAPPCEGALPCEQAKPHIGEFMTVKGIFYCSYRPDLSGQPTFCNCPVPYPNHDFTALIWGSERPIFESCLGGLPEALLDNREICVSGLIEEYAGKAQIILTQCDQVTIVQ